MAPDRAGEQPPTAYPPAPPRALGKRLSPAERADLIATFAAGATQKSLAAKYGISIRSIKRLAHVNSNRPQATANQLTPDERATILAVYQRAGATMQELADKFGVSLSTIKRVIRQS